MSNCISQPKLFADNSKKQFNSSFEPKQNWGTLTKLTKVFLTVLKKLLVTVPEPPTTAALMMGPPIVPEYFIVPMIFISFTPGSPLIAVSYGGGGGRGGGEFFTNDSISLCKH